MNQPVGTLVYLASPYSSPNKVTQEIRFLSAVVANGWLMNEYQSKVFYSPIAHCHPVSIHCTLPGNWEYWKHLDETIISRCDALWVLCIPGWSTSTGVKAEFAYAVSLGLDIKYVHSQGDGSYVVSNKPSGE